MREIQNSCFVYKSWGQVIGRVILGTVLILIFAEPVWADANAGYEALQRGDFVTALRELLPEAEAGNPEAQHTIAGMYQDGRGVPIDPAKAVEWYIRAADKNFAPAQTMLGHTYEVGNGVRQDLNRALFWYILATESGSPYWIYVEMARAGLKRVRVSIENELPRAGFADLIDRDQVKEFFSEFVQIDPVAGQIEGRFVTEIHGRGIRPQLEMPNDPEKIYGKIGMLKDWFAAKLFLDVAMMSDWPKEKVREFLDKLGDESDRTLIVASTISIDYDLDVENFVFEKEIRKITSEEDRMLFMRSTLTDSILATELRILSWLYIGSFGEKYVKPENR